MANGRRIEKLCKHGKSLFSEFDCIVCDYECIERAAIMQFDGLSSKRQAEIDAVIDMHRRNKRNKSKRKSRKILFT